MDDRSLTDQVRGAFARPGVQIVVCGLLLALLFPARSSGAMGMTILGGALGVAVAMLWPRAPEWLRKPPERVTGMMVIAVVLSAGLSVFWEIMTVSPDWQLGDWGPHHAVLARIMPSLPGLDVPVWNHALSTGDAPLELYPAFTNLFVGHFALAVGLGDDLPLAFMVVAVLTHLAIAVATTAIAMRVAPRPIALVIGLLTLVDSGAVAHGGSVGLFRWALLHSALSLVFTIVAALAVLGALRRPRIGMSVTIWVFTALATACHPAGLIATAATCIALAAVALLASDVPVRRALVAIGHVALGAALGAVVWMPLAERLLEYGQHFPNAIRTPTKLLEDLLQSPSPVTSFSMIEYAGYFGLIAGLWSRRAAVVFVSAASLVLIVGLCDVAYLAFDLAPGQGVARLGTERLVQIARPFVMAASAYGIAVFVAAARSAWKDAPRSRRLIAAALIGVMSALVLRAAPAVWWNAAIRATDQARAYPPDRPGRDMLTSWAREQAADLRPDRWARAVFETDTHEHMHLTAETGLPTFHNSWLPALLLRERIEDLSPESLRRFNVRWVIAQDADPSLGNPVTQRALGSFRIREVPEWDGKFARIERGTGEIKTLRLDDRAVEIEVTGTTEPVLVALGTGYYPRWRATHASGAAEPVFAMKSHPDANLHVVAAWVAPGKTTFTCDGPLPSDGKGRWLTILAALCAVAAIIVWSRRSLRLFVLRRLALARTRAPRLVELGVRYGVPLLCIGLLARGCIQSRGVATALELGSGLRATATVEARFENGAWETCSYSRTDGSFSCPGMLEAHDGMTAQLNDAAPSWGFNTPGIRATAFSVGVEIRVTLKAKLDGTYWSATNAAATVSIEGMEPFSVTRKIVTVGDDGERTITITAALSTSEQWAFTFVRDDTILPDRTYLEPPPVAAPPEVRAIR